MQHMRSAAMPDGEYTADGTALLDRALGGAPADLSLRRLLPQTRKVVRHRPARFMRSMAIVYAGGPGHTLGPLHWHARDRVPVRRSVG
jgi:hypothetical protein